MDQRDQIGDLRSGSNQTRVRAHNERVVLSLVRRHGTLSKAEIARRSGLSAQTVTVIMRSLERDGLLLRGAPSRGRVGQPSIPMSLDPTGALSVGVKIGRRSLDLVLMDFVGTIREQSRQTYAYPRPKELFRMIGDGTERLLSTLSVALRQRVTGLGIAMPFELWNWADTLGIPAAEMEEWRHVDVIEAVGAATGLPVFVQNDGTAACGAEFLFGHGREASCYAYFFVGFFVGGGLVIDGRVVTGTRGNAGAFGTIRVAGPQGRPVTLLDCASLWVLEAAVEAQGGNPENLWNNTDNWADLGPVVDDWVAQTAGYLAEAALSACSVIDFEAVIIDG
ncbi:MAG: ROK family transcriptional regulator, partial [Pseudomonadota bacterium]